MLLALATAWIVVDLARHPMRVQNDIVHHVVWFRAYLPRPSLTGDPIGDFFLTSNGPLYRLFYETVARAGADPVRAAWGLALAAAAITAAAARGWLLALGASRSTAAAAAILMLLFLGFRDDLPSGGARAVGWPVLMVGLWALSARRPLPFAVAGAVGGGVYPSATVLLLVAAAVDLLTSTRGRTPGWRGLVPWAAAAVPAAAFILWTVLQPDPWGPTVSGEVARTLPHFGPDGRTFFFHPNPLQAWFFNPRAGLLPGPIYQAWPLLLAVPAALIWARPRGAFERHVAILALTAVGLWALAHATLFTLYLPSRFVSFGLGASMVALAASLSGHLADRSPATRTAVLLGLLIVPLVAQVVEPYPRFTGRLPRAPALMSALAADPAPGLVAGLAKDLDSVPVAANRPVYWSRKLAIPYKARFRALMDTRLARTIAAVTAPTPAPFLDLAAQERIAFLLLEADLFAGAPRPRWFVTAAAGVDVPPPARWRNAWPLRQTRCRTAQAGVWLFDVACLRASFGPLPASAPPPSREASAPPWRSTPAG